MTHAGDQTRATKAVMRGRLFRKYALVFVALLSATLLAGGLVQGYFSYQQSKSALGRIQREKAVTAATRIEQFVGETERRIRSAQPPLGVGGTLGPDERRANLLRLLAQAPEIAEVAYLDGEGKEQLRLSSVARNLVGGGADRSREPAFEHGRLGQTWFGPVYFREGSEPFLTVAAGETGPAAGVTVAEVNLKFLLDVVSRITLGQAGRAYVVDAGGQLIAHPDINLVLQRTDLSSLAQVRAARAASPDPDREAITANDLNGRQVLTSYEAIFPPGWYVFVEQPLDEALAPLDALVVRTTLLLAAGLGLAVAASLFLARRMTRPIRALQAGAARIAAGDLDQHIVVRTGDELEALAEEFNRMTAQLQASYTGLEQKVEARTHELEAANRAKSEFLSRMSHELRTPLNAIIGFAEIMEMDPQTPARQQDWVRRQLTASRQLLGLINEVLDIARIEAGRLALSPEPVAVGEAVYGAADLVRPLAAERSVRLELDLPADSRWVRADRQRLGQVLLNLLTNAVKYNHDGGSVTVRCEERPDNRLRLTVRDTGPGIPADKLDRLFVPFERLDAAESGVEGTGLGLAIAKHLIQAMDGDIGVESTPGAGSSFWLELPRAAAPAMQFAAEVAWLGPAANGAGDHAGTVLYVEDNLSNLSLMEQLLTFRPAVKLVTAMQGTLGLQLARHHRPDLVLLDLNLPDLQGDEVLARLQADELTRDIPVVIVSADATPGQIERLLAAGAHDYLTKPLQVRRLLDLLDAVLTSEGARR